MPRSSEIGNIELICPAKVDAIANAEAGSYLTSGDNTELACWGDIVMCAGCTCDAGPQKNKRFFGLITSYACGMNPRKSVERGHQPDWV